MLSRILLLFLVCSFGLYAIDGAVSVYLVEKERRFISEELIVKVDLKSTAFSIKDAKIGLENSRDYIIQAPGSASSLQTVDINGTDWQIVHYEYKLYPLHAGKIEVPKVEITFSASMGYGQPEKSFTFQSEALKFRVDAPEGVGEGDFVLSTVSYSLESDISPKISETNSTKIKVGDAIEIKVTQKAQNVPDLLLRPFTFSKNEHFKIYRDEPLLKMEVLGSKSIATRRDSFTFVASNEGNVSIPSQTFIWWNPETQVLHKEKTTALRFTVLADPKTATFLEDEEEKPWILNIVSIFILIAILYKFIPYIQKKNVEKKVATMQSEEGKFKRLLVAAKGDNMAHLYRDLYAWLEVADPKLSRGGFRSVVEVQPSFSTVLKDLETALVEPEKAFDNKKFDHELIKLRKVLLQQSTDRQEGLPQKINP